MRVGWSYIPVLQPLLLQDVRFSEVKAGLYTGNGGCLYIRGTLNSESDFPDLKKLVETSKPPLSVLYDLELPNGKNVVDRSLVR